MIRTFVDETTAHAVIYGKYPKGGSCVASAGKVILIATFNEAKDQTAAACNETIQLMAKYLLDSPWPSSSSSGGGVSDAVARISWLPFCEQMLLNKGNVKECLICSKKDGVVFASATFEEYEAKGSPKVTGTSSSSSSSDSSSGGISSKFALQQYQAELMQEDGTEKLSAIHENAALSSLLAKQPGARPSGGIRINQVKYQFIRGGIDDDSKCNTIQGKKVKGGCVVAACESLIVVATFDERENHTSAGCATVVADLAKYLKATGL